MSKQERTAPTNPAPDDDIDPAPVAEKVKFDVPKVNGQGEKATFISFILDAELSKGHIEEDSDLPSQPGPGRPPYSAYAFPYVPPEKPKEDSPGAESAGQKTVEPLYVVYVYPFELPGNVELSGDGGGAHGALGGNPGPTKFYGQIKPLIEAGQGVKPEEKPEPTEESKY